MKLFLFLSDKESKLNNRLIKKIKEYNFDILNIFSESNCYNESKYNDLIDFSISFLNPFIIKDKRIIIKGCINFHPSLPKYKGVCGASLALYNKDSHFGSTVHYIDKAIDNGNIILTSNFTIPHNINCFDLSYLAKAECLICSNKILLDIYNSNKLPKYDDNISWGNISMTRKKFQKWITIDIDNSNLEEIKNKIIACSNTVFDGPFFKIKNRLFKVNEII